MGMIQDLKDELVHYCQLHYLVNLMLCGLFFFLKKVSPFCDMMFEDCEMDVREWEWLTFLGCFVVIKNRRQPSSQVYISTVMMFGKIMNALMFFRLIPVMGVFYVILCVLHSIFLPEPAYEGPEYITYFRGPHLEAEIERDKRVTWIVEFYATWAPSCVNFAPLFSELSGKYALDNLKFGKIDASRYPDVAKRFSIDTSAWSKQLPTVVVFQNGKESVRVPPINAKGQVIKYQFSLENLIKDFELNEMYQQCKSNPIPRRKGAADKAVADKIEAAPANASSDATSDHPKSE